MRITESRILELAAGGVGDARARTARAGEAVQTGRAVGRPSDDPTAWAMGARAAARRTLSSERGAALGTAIDNLAQTDDALRTIGDSLTRASELGLQAVNGTLSAADRAAFAPTLAGLQQTILGSGNRRASDGEYLLAGSRGTAPPFDAGGVYQGDTAARRIHVAENDSGAAAVTGSALTSSGGPVDVMQVVSRLASAAASNDVAGMKAALAEVQKAIAQVAQTRATAGGCREALMGADEARGAFEQRLGETISRAVDADPIGAVSELARSSAGLEAARATADQLASLFRSVR